jgi:AraC-like DNA-binding protein
MAAEGAPSLLAFDGPLCPWIHAADDTARPRPWAIPQRRLTHWLLVCSLSGEEQIVVEGTPYRIAAGSSYLIQPGWLCDLGSAGGSQPAWVHFDLRFDPQRRQHPYAGPYDHALDQREAWLQPQAAAVWGCDLPVVVPPELAPRFAADIPALIARWKVRDRFAGLDTAQRLSGLLLALVQHLQSADSPLTEAAPELRIERAEALARQSLDTDFDVADFAAAAGWSRSRFSAVYQRLRGRSPGAFLRQERLDRAKALLTRPELPVAQVGALVGYPDPTVFGRVFREATGLTPGAWRERSG